MSDNQFGLPANVLEGLRHVFSKYQEIETVVLYGSRALGTFRPNSDIDLTLTGKALSLSILLKISGDIDDLLLPYKVDLSIKDQIDNPQLIAHIDRVGVPFYKRR